MFTVRPIIALVVFAASLAPLACQNKDTTISALTDTDPQPLTADPNVSAPETNPILPTPQQNNTPIPAATGANILFVGRIGTTDGNNAVLSWPGTQIIAGFTGTSIAAKLTPADQGRYPGLGNVDNYIDVSIDGNYATTLRITQGTQQITLADKLSTGTHWVKITKRTEAQIGSLSFSGFVYAPGGGGASAPALPTRRIEFIGDSGLVGYGADADVDYTNMCSFTPATENASASFALVAAQSLSAQAHLVGYSGKGIYQNRDNVNDATDTLPVLWTWTIGDNEFSEPDWQPSQWLADAVVIVIGGNDFASTDSSGKTQYVAPSASAFAAKANPFMAKLRAAYPKAWLFVTTSPMLDATIRAAAESYAKAMVTSVGGSNAAFVALPYDDGSRGYGCDYHMNVATHRVVGQALSTAISSKTGW